MPEPYLELFDVRCALVDGVKLLAQALLGTVCKDGDCVLVDGSVFFQYYSTEKY